MSSGAGLSPADALRVLIVDDEALARSRLRSLVAACRDPAARVCAEASLAGEALEALSRQPFDVVLLDVNMPGMDGLALARVLHAQASAPAVVFVTAHAEHALAAFEVEAVDYLTKPVRLERLEAALQKVVRRRDAPQPAAAEAVLLIQDRGRTERVPLSEVLYFKAELKYVTVRTRERIYLMDNSLNELEERFAGRFLRVHRNALVAPSAVRALQRHVDPEEGDGWALRLEGVDDLLAVSRRQLAAVREAMER